MFVDASAIVAVLTKEPERALFREKIESARSILMSSLTIYEATLGLARITRNNLVASRATMRDFISISQARIVPLDVAIGELAVDAFDRFGKGRHRAGLNMGDCFSYACAKAHRVPLLFKGDDFVHTDILPA
jgi:ribonuclease VapC